MGARALPVLATDLLANVLWMFGIRLPWRNRLDARIVHYHGIGDGRAPCFRFLSDETPADTFEQHLDYLNARYRVVSLQDAVRDIEGNLDGSERPTCVISFDDGLRTVHTQALPLLAARGLPATVFVNTAAVGNHTLLWLHASSYLMDRFGVQRVADAYARHAEGLAPPPPPDARGLLAWFYAHYAKLTERKFLDAAFDDLGLSLAGVASEQRIYLEWDDLAELANQHVVAGSHTANHAPLAQLSAAQKRVEIGGARDALASRGHDTKFVSLPFGMRSDYGDGTVEAALSAGHTWVLEVGTGANRLATARQTRVLSRVPLGAVSRQPAHLHAALEVRPSIKAMVKRG